MIFSPGSLPWLFLPRLLSFRNRLRRLPGYRWKLALLLFLILTFWGVIFYGLFRILHYFQSIPGFGEILSQKILSMLLLAFSGVLIYSHLITALSSFFLSKDLVLFFKNPVPLLPLFISRYLECFLDASWMVVAMGLPVLICYGMVFHGSLLYYLGIPLVFIPFLFLCGSLGILLTLILSAFLPIRRTRDLMAVLGLLSVVMLFLLFRLMRPEQLVNPEQLSSLVDYLGRLTAQESLLLPSRWIQTALWSLLNGRSLEALLPTLLIWSTAGMVFMANLMLAWRYYFFAFSQAQEGSTHRTKGSGIIDGWIRKGLPLRLPFKEMLIRDLKIIVRDKTQWSQFLILGALIFIYVYNFSVLPLHKSPLPTLYLTNVISFLNLGLAGFVLASVAVRFVFPAISAEGYNFWIIRSGPVSMKSYLWYKFLFYFFPLLLLSEILILFTNHQLSVSPAMNLISSLTMAGLTFALVGLAIGLGAAYPRYGSENIGQMATGFGGFLYMVFSLLVIALTIAVEAGPIYRMLMSDLRRSPFSPSDIGLMAASFTLTLGLHVFSGLLPMRKGIRHLQGGDGL
jgi:ABC-2 type transport system permease protein